MWVWIVCVCVCGCFLTDGIPRFFQSVLNMCVGVTLLFVSEKGFAGAETCLLKLDRSAQLGWIGTSTRNYLGR